VKDGVRGRTKAKSSSLLRFGDLRRKGVYTEERIAGRVFETGVSAKRENATEGVRVGDGWARCGAVRCSLYGDVEVEWEKRWLWEGVPTRF
jgi:hypothetical protein